MANLNETLSSILTIVVSIVVMSLALWLSGKLLVGSRKAKFTDAIWISVLGSIASYVVSYFATGLLGGLLGSLITLIIVLLLVKHFFDCGWLKALLIAIIAAIIFIVIVAILGLIGIGVVSSI